MPENNEFDKDLIKRVDGDLEELDDDGSCDSGAEDNVWDEKEIEARETIQEFFMETVDELEKVNKSIHNIISKDPIFIGGKYRLDVTDYYINLSNMSELNKLISECGIYLKNYIDFGKESSPNFDYVKNLMFLFQENFMKEQARRFAIVQKRDYGKVYITKNIVDYYLKGIGIWLARIIGALTVAGDYIVTAPPSREPSPQGVGDFNDTNYNIGADVDYNNIGYVNNTPWWDKGVTNSYIRGGNKVKPRLRDVGDAHTR